jgi:branched-chain amino acid transport system substrate-binding protein
MRPLGTAMWDNAVKIARSQALFERAIFVAPFFSQSNRPEVQSFIESYRAKYKTTPNFLAAQGFDAGTVIMNAIAKRDSSGSSFGEAVKNMPPYSGVTGVIAARASGELERAFYVVEVLRDTFQEKMPSSDSQQSSARTRVMGTSGSLGVGSPRSPSPVLGDYEKVDSGY